MEMKQLVMNTRKVLVYAAKYEGHSIPIEQASKDLELSSNDFEEAANLLESRDLLKVSRIGQRYTHWTVKITLNGKMIVEDMKNDQRWEKLIPICDEMDDYSFDRVLQVLSELMKKEIECYINR